MDVSEWQHRLEQNFTENETMVGRLFEVKEHEQEYGSYVTREFYGYSVLVNSFFSFYLETLQMADANRQCQGQSPTLEWYGAVLLDTATTFRTFRAAENLLLNGYPLSGYALQRDLTDRAVFRAAIVSEVTNYSKLNGLDALAGKTEALTQKDRRKIQKSRIKEEARVMKEMVRPRDGIDKGFQNILKLWHDMFNMEVHGAQLSFAREGSAWIEGQDTLPVYPRPDSLSLAMYTNRSCEVGWMLLRTFPFLQLEPQAFGNEWTQKWHILDESFRFMVEDLEQMGKKIASAIIHIVDTRFPFSPENTSYHE